MGLADVGLHPRRRYATARLAVNRASRLGSLGIVGSALSQFWSDLVADDRQGIFLVLVAFLAAFAFIRTSARISRSPRFSWWPGSVVSESGVHLHHLVWGICLMLGSGTLGFALVGNSPWFEVCACLFGIGAGLTIDEFALWVYLQDVYWTQEGRSSIDAAVIAAAAMLLLLLGVQPVDFPTGSVGAVASSAAGLVTLVLLVTACFAKERVLHGAIGTFFWPLAAYGAVRLGKPRSPWGRRRYHEDKLARAQRRFRPERRTERFKNRVRDAIGGAPSEVSPQRLTKS
jgi:hypothetical protein